MASSQFNPLGRSLAARAFSGGKLKYTNPSLVVPAYPLAGVAVVSFAASGAGVYRLGAGATYLAGANPQVQFQVSYTDAFGTPKTFNVIFVSVDSQGSPTSVINSSGSWFSCYSNEIYCAIGSLVTVTILTANPGQQTTLAASVEVEEAG